jgi:glycosyltransferase involved in cell wall biosynthesis
MSKLTTVNPDGQVVTNSKFTLEHAKKAYQSRNIQVLYPPAIEEVRFSGFTGEGIVSVGSFHPNKRQLFQLQMAKKFPSADFRIIGSLASKSYYQSCQEYIHNNELDNVTLLTDIPSQQLYNELKHSRVFLHTMKNERFGIAPVEAINYGCIPVVHNSGGQREVVHDSTFRFNSKLECEAILSEVLSGRSPSESKTRTHLKRFTEAKFISTLSTYI